ncbi:MAG: site-2 protease family protein [Candidatus Binatia bacterium]
MEDNIRQIAVWALPVLFAVVLHEVAHGWVANRLGDPTAARLGRLTLNPISHVDPIGTILIPLFLVAVGAPFIFGYAKPVPVNFYNLRNPKRDMIWVAAAGPVTNIFLAVASVYLLKAVYGLENLLPAFLHAPLAMMAEGSVTMNVMLAAFNLLPLPPLDGGRVLVGMAPQPLSSIVARIEPFGFFILLALLMTHTLDFILGPFIYFVLRLVQGLVIG